jgi:hypothetical protein
MIIEMIALFKGIQKKRRLFFGWVDSISESLSHSLCYYQSFAQKSREK